ncbi:hypothetical protein LRB11_13515 [Ectothiorhodospira haloalkaliphila]|uniref:hypothetical protein n=1 Tax=Ectothiorhodospira haloalkaliphila TaxID=421628 RepID=UPI001EE85988|nr:hypothetical protein [Ectothiorhodospira haloalkaliphila]MCG5525937.1 hypothetical protein [Ectothiorhodospira haloalkaliphila]
MRLHGKTARKLEYRDSLAPKVVFHLAILAVAVAALFLVPVGGELRLTDGYGQMCHKNAIGIPVNCRDLGVTEISAINLESPRHRPGSGPPSRSLRLEIVLTDGNTLPLTRHFQSPASGVSLHAHKLERYLESPSGEVKIEQMDAEFLWGISMAGGLLGLYGLLWGIRQTRITADLDRDRLTLQRRGLLRKNSRQWQISQVESFAMEPQKDAASRRMRPVLRLKDGSRHVLQPYSLAYAKRYQGMLEQFSSFCGTR